MEKNKIVEMKKGEFTLKEYVKKYSGKGKVSKVKIEYTPVGEKIIISTGKPGLIIGRGGERIAELTNILKKKFKLENPHIEIDEIKEPEYDARIVADDVAMALENSGPLKFKVIAYRNIQKIMNAGALGVEIRLSGKLPGARAKTWRFSQGYLKKVGESAKVVDRAKAIAQTRPGVVGVKVSILSPHAVLKDKIVIDDEVVNKIKENMEKKPLEVKIKKTRKAKKE